MPTAFIAPQSGEFSLPNGQRRAAWSCVPLDRAEDARVHRAASPACQHVADFWDSVTADFLEAKATNVQPPLDRWFTTYSGRGRGEVVLDCFPEPYLGDILGAPRAAMLALNPGGGVTSFQAVDGIFADEIRHLGSYREWAKTWPYLAGSWPWRNRHHQSRMMFLKRWFCDELFPPAARIDFELYPWHSQGVTGAMRPDAQIIREFIWGPLSELPVEYIFAFGKPWLGVLDQLPDIEIVDRIGDGGRRYESTRKAAAHTVVVKARTSWGAWLIVEKHGGSAGPPGMSEIDAIRCEFGF